VPSEALFRHRQPAFLITSLPERRRSAPGFRPTLNTGHFCVTHGAGLIEQEGAEEAEKT